jgi:hypothetical protein
MHRQMADMMKQMKKMGGRMPNLGGVLGGGMPQLPPGFMPKR